MTTIKSYTDLSQSKVLAEFLPLESADMYWYLATKGNPKAMFNEGYNENGDFELPCWSLTALIGILPNGYVIVKNYHSLYYVESRDHEKSTNIFNNPVDACVAMIIKLHKLNLW